MIKNERGRYLTKEYRMGPIDIIIIAAVSVAVIAIVGVGIWKKKTGRSSGCGCGCDGCPHAKSCSSGKGVEKDETDE